MTDTRAPQNLTLTQISTINRARCERWHPGFPSDGWTGADWSNAMQGEAGEAGNIVKKLRRVEFGLTQAAGDSHEDLVGRLALEIGDTFLYLDLLAQHYGLALADCVVATFNRVSVREGFPERLPTAPGCGQPRRAQPAAGAGDAPTFIHAWGGSGRPRTGLVPGERGLTYCIGRLYQHLCSHVEEWPTTAVLDEQGCDACESAPVPGGWQPLYRRSDSFPDGAS
jgi:hypothetical protein